MSHLSDHETNRRDNDPETGWAFPVDERSSFGTLWTLTPEAIRELRSKDEWISSFRRGVIIASRAWGWDVITGTVIKETGLMWTEWPVRLFKMGLSCMIFKQCDLEEGLAKFAHYLSSRKHSLVFHSSHTGGCLEVIKAWDVRRPTILP